MNFKQLTFAREFRGLSQTELSKNIEGLSQSNLSKFEKGLSTLSEQLQEKIIEFLGFPKDFYNKRIYNVLENSNYRKKSVITKAEILNFELRCKLIGFLVDEMSETLDWPEFKLDPLNVEDGYSVKKIAIHTRKLLNIDPEDPIKDIYTLLERAGIITYEIEANEKFDGISFTSKNGYPIVLVNKSFSNDRKRFTIAHELGHIIMHNERNFILPDYKTDKIKETEANQFASEFLMPESEIKNSLLGITLKDLTPLKTYWLTSMASILRRALDLGCIDKNKYTNFNIELSRLGYKRIEPVNVYIDSPTVFKKGYSLFKSELGYSDEEFAKAFNLPIEVINEIFNQNKPTKIISLNKIQVI